MLSSATLALGCVRFEGMPSMPVGTSDNVQVYSFPNKVWSANVEAGRELVRTKADLTWKLVGTEAERLAGPREMRSKYAGIIFVGDSQIREVAWSALQLLAPHQPISFFKGDAVFRNQHGKVASACVPQSIGKTGFTATCGKLGGVHGCDLHSPFNNRTHAERMRKLLLTRPHEWDGTLSMTKHACRSDFFLSYQATWGAVPIVPTSLPQCMHPGAGSDGRYGITQGDGVFKPILFVLDGGGLHEMEFCDKRRFTLPQIVLRNFAPALARSSVVWQPAGGGFQMISSRRYKGDCARINAEQVAANETRWLDSQGIRHYAYDKLAMQFAPLMFDAIHFTYYWVPCKQTFPEMARLVAQLGFQQAVGRPVRVCSAAELKSPLPAGAMEGGLSLSEGTPHERFV